MKNISVKMKITLWYTGVVLLIALVALGVILVMSRQMLWSNAERKLQSETADFAEEMEFEDGYLDLEDLQLYKDGVLFSVYDENGRLCYGSVPEEFPADTVLKSGSMQQIKATSREWMTYDLALTYADQIWWVRGIASSRTVSETVRTILLIGCIACPLLVLLAAIGGYYITGKVLRPVEQALENERQFTSDASHELRTPVTVILSQCEYALLSDTEEEERRECLQVIQKQAANMSGLISQLLQLARMDHTLTEEKMEYVDLGKLIGQVTEELQEKARQNKITLESHIHPTAMVYGEELSLTRVLINLIENSIQYGRPEGRTTIILEQQYHKALLTVQDDGIGMSREQMAHIWKRFYRADKARTIKGEVHAGLGLSMVKKIIEAHHGTIQVESELEKGTIFTIQLPIKAMQRS